MARNAASKLFSSPPVRAHLVSVSRSSSYESRSPRRANTNPGTPGGGRGESANAASSSLILQEIASLIAGDDVPRFPRSREAGYDDPSVAPCTQGARRMAPENGASGNARRRARVASSDAWASEDVLCDVRLPVPEMFDTENASVADSGSSGLADAPWDFSTLEIEQDDLLQCVESEVRGNAISPVSGMYDMENARVPFSGSAGHADHDGILDCITGVQSACSVAKDSDIGVSDLENVSPLVRRITEVVRTEVPGLSMERRLDALGVTYTPEVVNMVLKRCFKVGHLGFRFFNWVKQSPGFRHSTETYNTMLYIAGEARNFELVERLVDDMDAELCRKDIKTWTILLASYGKATQIGKMLSTFVDMTKSGCVPDIKMYREILRTLCNAAQPELALEFYKDVASRNMEVGFDVYQLLLKCLARSDNVEAVYSVRDDIIKSSRFPEEDVYVQTLRSFCISGKLEEAQKVFEEMKKKSITNSVESEILFKGFCRAGRMDEALKIMEYMKNTSFVSSRTYGFLIDGYLRKRDLVKALELLRGMRESGCVPLASSYTQLMQHLFASDQYKAACELYEEMLENGVEPDIVTTTALIAGHLRHGQTSQAWNYFRSINERGQRPTFKAYTVFIQELCKASRPLEAFKLLKEMSESNMKPLDGTFGRVISALRDNHYWEEASIVENMWRLLRFEKAERELQPEPLEKVNNVEVSASSLSQDADHIQQAKEYSEEDVEEVCRILSSSNDWSSMQEALERRSLYFTPDMVDAILHRCKRNGRAALQFFSWVGKRSYYTPTTKTYNTAMKLAGSAKDFRHMRYLYREMRRVGCSPTPGTWTVMISQYGHAGLTKMALDTFYQMKSDGVQPDKSTYNQLILILCRRKGQRVDAAIKIFQEMCRTGYMLRNEMAGAYLSALCECEKTADARSSVVSMCKRGFPAQVGYSMLIRSLSRAGRMEEVLQLLNEIENLGCFRDQYIYGSLIHALLRSDRFDEASAKLAEMKSAGIPQSTPVYTSFIVHFFQKRNIAKAMDMLKEMTEKGCEPTIVTYSALIRGYMNMGMISEAWAVFHRMKLRGLSPDFQTYSMFMSCLCRAGRSKDGLLLIREMLDSGIIPSALNFRTVFHGLNREGKLDLAHSVLQSKWQLWRRRRFSR